MKKGILLILLLLVCVGLRAQTKLFMDSMLKKAYIAKYKFSEGLMCVPFYCDPFMDDKYKKQDTTGLCGRYVFVNRDFVVKIKPVFSMPCWFEPRFGEGLCAVNINGEIAYIDTSGLVSIRTGLTACSQQRNRATPFKNGKAKLYHSIGILKPYYDVYYIDRKGHRIAEKFNVYVKVRGKPPILPKPVDTAIIVKPIFELPKVFARNKYPLPEAEAKAYLQQHSHQDNRMLLFFNCGSYQMENMALADTTLCDQFVFTDSMFNVRIRGFQVPCAFEPEFSEGLCAVAIDSTIMYIDTTGKVMINTGMHACNSESNKASTFHNGIATLYRGDKNVKGVYTTTAINTRGERVRLLEFDDLELAEKKVDMFTNLTPEEAVNCFVGRGKTNGLWFLVEKSGKIRKKLEKKQP